MPPFSGSLATPLASLFSAALLFCLISQACTWPMQQHAFIRDACPIHRSPPGAHLRDLQKKSASASLDKLRCEKDIPLCMALHSRRNQACNLFELPAVKLSLGVEGKTLCHRVHKICVSERARLRNDALWLSRPRGYAAKLFQQICPTKPRGSRAKQERHTDTV